MKESYLQEFQASKIDPEIIALNFRELTGANVYEYLAIGCKQRNNDGRLPKKWLDDYRHCEHGGWWCSGMNLMDLSPLDWGCFKPDRPRLDAWALKPIKYEHPKGVPTNVFALSVAGEPLAKINARYGVNLSCEDFWGEVIVNRELPVIITEGAKKTACLLSQGFVAIGLPGIWGAYRKDLLKGETQGLIPPVHALGERLYIFAFDQDTKPETKKQVKSAINTTAKAIKRNFPNAPEPLTLTWDDDFKGVDDLIAAKGAAYFEVLWDKVQKRVEVVTSTPLAQPGQWDEGEQDGVSEAARKDPDRKACVLAVGDVFSDRPYIAVGDNLYGWNGKFYERLDPGKQKQRLKRWASKNPIWDPKKEKEVYAYESPKHISEFWQWALLEFAVPEETLNPPGLNLANGVLRLKVEGRKAIWALEDHSPKNRFLYCSEVEYREDADPENCEKLLAVLDEPGRTAFLRLVAAALDLPTIRRYHGRTVRAALCIGAGQNGKDSLLEAISAIFTDEQICSASFSAFTSYDNGRQFTLAKLKGKRINWASENNKGVTLDYSQSLNLAITGDKGLEYELKNKNAEPFTPQCVHFFSCNQPPKMKSGLDSLLSRLAIFKFDKTFAQEPVKERGELQADPRFKYDRRFVIEEVAPPLLNRLLSEFQNFLMEGVDFGSQKAALADLQDDSTHLWSFCHDLGVTPAPDKGIYLHDLWEVLKTWYIDNGTLEIVDLGDGKTKHVWSEQANAHDRNVTGANQLYKRFKQLFPKVTKHRETQDPVNKGRFYLRGLSVPNFAFLLHYPDTEPVSASPPLHSASLSLHSAGEAEKGSREASQNPQSLASYGSEADHQKDHHTAPKNSQTENFSSNGNGKTPKLDPERETLLADILFWRNGLGWDASQLKAFVSENFGGLDAMTAPIPDLLRLKQALSKEMPYISTFQEVF